MAKLGRNAVVHSASGKFGDLIVFRQLKDGRMILSQAPRNDPNRTYSEKQIAVRKKFQEAIIYGKGIMKNPEMKDTYSQKADNRLSAYNVAIADFSHAPHIDEIDVTGYYGNEGDKIIIRAVDDFIVKEVSVTIYNADGSIADEGSAKNSEINALDWEWTATRSNGELPGDKIVVRATDIPGNLSEKEQVLE